jgi:glycerate 2-kinase
VLEDHRALLRAMFDAAVAAASPDSCVPKHLPKPPRRGKTVVVGAGKAAAAMAAAVEAHWDGPIEGLVVTRYGHGAPCKRIEVIEAAHPVPDAAGREAARRIIEKVSGLGEDDLVLCLISGGGSALLALPAPGLTLEDKQSINRALLRSGAQIGEMNCVRKHLSAIKGGLAVAAAPARVVSLIISDVPGDDLTVIASGPTVPDATTSAEAIGVLKKYKIEAPRSVLEHLRSESSETPKPGNARFSKDTNILIATPQDALEASASVARRAGFHPVILGDAIEGEARDVALVHAAIAKQVARYGQPAEVPCALISGGETTVTVRGKGRGGRNAEFLLSLGLALNGQRGIAAIAADTDGIDGSEDNAGSVLLPDTLVRAAKLSVDAKALLANNDAYTVFERLDDFLVTGPTRTNVNDFRAILVYERA